MANLRLYYKSDYKIRETFKTQVAETLQEHESRLFVKQITVTEETKNNYREATAAEKDAWEASQQPI